MNYYASKYNDPRAIAFRKAYRNAPMGQNFMFENQPYARPGPPGLLAEEGPGTATGYVKKRLIPESDQAYMSPEKLAIIAATEANRKRLGPRIGGESMFMREGPHITPSGYVDPTKTSRRWVKPSGPIAQSPEALMTLEQQIQRDRWASDPYNAPRFPATDQRGVAKGYDHQRVGPPSSVTGRYNPGQDTGQPQGLLADDMSGPRWTDRWKKEKIQEPGTDKSGWMADKRMRDSQNRNLGLARLFTQFGQQQQSSDDGWGGPLTHY